MPSTAEPARPVSEVRVLLLLLLVYITNLVDRHIVGVLAVPIKADLEITDTQLGLLGGFAFILFYSVIGIPVAWLADRKSRTLIITVSLALWSGFTIASGMAQTFVQLFLARIGVGIGEAGGSPPSHSLISDYFRPEKRARALAIFSLGAPIGTALGIFFGGWIASTLGWRAAFVIVGLVGIILVPIVRFAIPEPVRGRYDPVVGGTKARSASVSATARAITASPSFWLLSVGAGIAAIPSAGLIFWLPSFFQRSFGLDLTQASLFYGSIVLVGGLTGTWLGGWLADRFGRRNRAAYALVPAIAFLAAAPVYVLALYAPSLTVAWSLFVVWQAFAIMWLAPVVAAIQHIVAPNMRATASASFLFINNIVGAGFGTFVLGFMADLMLQRYGDEALRYSMLYSLISYLIAAALTAAAAKGLQREWHGVNTTKFLPAEHPTAAN